MEFLQYLLLLLVAYLGSSLGLPVFMRLLEEAGLRRVNYAGREIPFAAGLFLLFYLPFLLVLALLAGVKALPIPLDLVFGFGLTGFGLAGLVDDWLGTATDKGFCGHFRAMFREGRLTSGALKAISGAVMAVLVALALAAVDRQVFGPWHQVLLNAVILASAANLLNLFDLRPGRAGKVFYLGLAICAALGRNIEVYGAPCPLVAVSFIPLFRRDLRAGLMLGDTGANFLGAALGMAVVFWLSPHAKMAAAAILLGLQLLSECRSFSALIERVGILRRLDRWGRGAD